MGRGVREDENSEDDAEDAAEEDDPGNHLVGLEVDEQEGEHPEQGYHPGAGPEGVHHCVDVVLALGVADPEHVRLEDVVGGQAEEPDPG